MAANAKIILLVFLFMMLPDSLIHFPLDSVLSVCALYLFLLGSAYAVNKHKTNYLLIVIE